MKHFIVEIIYTSPIEVIENLTAAHREYLQTGYQRQIILLSGPKIPRTGGIVIAKTDSLTELETFFSKDPYFINNAAEYRFIEFNPKSHQSFLKDWLE